MTQENPGPPLPVPPQPGRWSVDTSTWRIHWSQQARDIHEAGTSLPTVWEALDYVDPADRPDLFAHVLACVREARPFETTVTLTSASGVRRRVRVTGFPGMSGGGAPTAHGTVEVLPAQPGDGAGDPQARLHAVLRDWELFGQAIPHELRSRASVISGYAKAIAASGQPLSDRCRHHLERLVSVASELGALIDGVTAFAPLPTRSLNLQPVDLGALARDCMDALRAAEPDRAVPLVLTGDLLAVGDPDLLRLAMHNLLANAWKFTRTIAGARIEVRAEERDGHMLYSVADNGVGFDMADATRVFAPFTRLHSTYEGTGLGLAITRRVVERHGGSIWACSSPGQGASFFFELGPRDPA